MNRILFPLVLCLMFVGCEVSQVDTAQEIKGHTFSANYTHLIMELTFYKDMTVLYRYRNSWEKDVNSRSDLNYEVLSDTEFVIFTDDIKQPWGEGVFYNEEIPYILLSNFLGDTLYLKK